MTTMTPTNNLPDLPPLDRGPVPPEFAALNPEFRRLLKQRTEILKEATSARAEYQRKEKQLIDAREQDGEAFAQAALDGKPDPGREHEAEAIRELDEAHRKATGQTLAANKLNQQIRTAVTGKAGETALAKAEEEIAKAVESLAANASSALADLAAISNYGRLVEQLTKARNGRKPGKIPHSTNRIRPVVVSGQPVNPQAVLEGLVNDYGPQVEA
jgi:hypothetical protein